MTLKKREKIRIDGKKRVGKGGGGIKVIEERV